MDAMIEVRHLTRRFGPITAVDDVSFRISRGSVTGLLGGNGAGKTTTIAMIMGLVLPTSGRIQVLGCSMPDQSADVLGRMNFESPYVDMPMRLTVRQNLTIFGRLYAVANLSERIEQLAADLDLGDFLDRANGKISAGQKTRVALAKALTTFAKATPTISVKAAVVQGRGVAPAMVDELANLPGRAELAARLLYVLQAPMQQLVTVLSAVPSLAL